MDYRINKPILNGKTPEENIAKVDTWIADTADKLNYVLTQLYRERNADGNEADKPD